MRQTDIAIVIIGQNVRGYLDRVLPAAQMTGCPIVYVDSGSQDGSLDAARTYGALGIALSDDVPHSHARGRNAGLIYVREHFPNVVFIQFIDGDSVLDVGWLEEALDYLLRYADVAALTGQISEPPEAGTWFNRLMDMEWAQTPPGEASSFIGTTLARALPFAEVGGFNPALVSFEEAELSMRLQQAGWRVARMGVPMAVHLGTHSTFAQWWRRSMRTGHGRAQVAWLYRRERPHLWLRERASNVLWALALPSVALISAVLVWPWGGLLWGGYPIQLLRMFAARRQRGFTAGDSLLDAAFTLLGKVPQMMGQLRFHLTRLTGR